MKKTLSVLILLLLATACSQNNVDETPENTNYSPRNVSVEDSHIEMSENYKEYTDKERADYLANLAASIPDVKGANAVVAGDIAVVGINIEPYIERSEVGTIKYTVTESIKKDPLGAGVIVVADPDITARLDEINEDIQNGQPIQGVMNELADIVGRIMPDVPVPDMNKNPEESLEEEKNKTEGDTEQEIEKEQKNHSTDKNQ